MTISRSSLNIKVIGQVHLMENANSIGKREDGPSTEKHSIISCIRGRGNVSVMCVCVCACLSACLFGSITFECVT